MRNYLFGMAAAAIAITIAPAASAQTTAYNACPIVPYSFGAGNNYTPCNSVVLTLANAAQLPNPGQLYARWKPDNGVALASNGSGEYTYAAGSMATISYEFGFTSPDAASYGVWTGSALAKITDRETGNSLSYNPILLGGNFTGSNSVQNSEKVNFFGNPLGFTPTRNATYDFELFVAGNTVKATAVVGTGAPAVTPGAVPEPATWAMMLLGFGFVGAALRRPSDQKLRIRFA